MRVHVEFPRQVQMQRTGGRVARLALLGVLLALAATSPQAQDASAVKRAKKAQLQAAEEAAPVADAGAPNPAQYRCMKRPTDSSSPPQYIFIQANSSQEARARANEQLGDTGKVLGCGDVQKLNGLQSTAPPPPIPDSAKGMPFAGRRLGDYFDAVYNADAAEIRRLDAKYMARLQAAMRNLQSDRVFGKALSSIDMNKSTLLVPMIKAYVRNYGEAYSACLRRDAVTFQWRETITDQSGKRTRDIVYRMNPEFVPAYNDTQPQAGEVNLTSENVAALGDDLLGNPIASMESATFTLMGQYRCDDPRIKRFETRLLAMYAQIAK